MNRRMAILGAAALGLGAAVSAHAQMALDWMDSDERTKRLEDEAVKTANRDQRDDDPRFPTSHAQTVSFDYFYPVALDEYRALGAGGVLLVSVVAKDPKALPLKRVVLRSGVKEVVLQPIADRRSTLAPTSPLVKTIGANREDAFYYLPKLPAKTADLWVIFSVPGQQFKAGSLSLAALPDYLQGVAPSQPDEATVKAVLAREYPDLVKP